MKHKISGKVVKGIGYGRELGFPTANLDRRQWSRMKVKPILGVWAGEVQVSNKLLKFKNYLAGIVIGPLDKHGLPKIEAHLLGFQGDLYGRKITIFLLKYLRPFQSYGHPRALKAQISKDIRLIKTLKLSI